MHKINMKHTDRAIKETNKKRSEECDEAERWDSCQLIWCQYPQQLPQRRAESLEDKASVFQATGLVLCQVK